MKCYHHSDKDAVGICTNCGRGVCENCVRVLENDQRIYCLECLDKVNLRNISFDILKRL